MEIINNIETKIENNETFTNKELLELALTPILESEKEYVIDQFYQTINILSRISFPTDEIKNSVYGVVLMLCSMYFEELNPIRKNIQGDLMGKVDCVVEAIAKGVSQNSEDIARNFLRNSDNSLEEIAMNAALSLERVKELKNNL